MNRDEHFTLASGEARLAIIYEMLKEFLRSGSEVYPIPLNDAHREVVKKWAADTPNNWDLWGNEESRLHNLMVFARAILAVPGPEGKGAPWVSVLEHRSELRRKLKQSIAAYNSDDELARIINSVFAETEPSPPVAPQPPEAAQKETQ